MHIERTHDLAYVREVMTHPAIWPHVSDDTGDRDTYAPPDHESIYWLVPVDAAPLGVFLVHPHSAVCWEVHTALLPQARGGKADEAAQALIAWVFGNTSCQKLITHVPAYNRRALAFAKRAGLVEEGRVTRSFLRRGSLIDQYLLGICKESPCQQQQS